MIDSEYHIETKHAGRLLIVNDFRERTLAEDPAHVGEPGDEPRRQFARRRGAPGDAPLGVCSIALYAQPSGAYLRDISTRPNDAAPCGRRWARWRSAVTRASGW
jgi:hypothetical protein